MSNDINNFLQTMVEAKQAIDAIPALRSRVTQLERQTHIQGETIANRELHIHNLKQNVTELTQKLRSVEVERDDAGFRALEEADRVQGMLTHLQQTVKASLELIGAVQGEALTVVKETERQESLELRNTHLLLEHTVSDLNGELASVTTERDDALRAVATLRSTLHEAKMEHATQGAAYFNRPFVDEPLPPVASVTVGVLEDGDSPTASIPGSYTHFDPDAQSESVGSAGDAYTTIYGEPHPALAEGSVSSDPTQVGQSGPSQAPSSEAKESSGTGTGTESSSQTEEKQVSDWPYYSQASHYST